MSDQPETRIAYGGHVVNRSGQNEQSLKRTPSIDASYIVSVHLANWFQRRRFLEIDQSETKIAYGGHVCQRIGTKCAFFTEDLL